MYQHFEEVHYVTSSAHIIDSVADWKPSNWFSRGTEAGSTRCLQVVTGLTSSDGANALRSVQLAADV